MRLYKRIVTKDKDKFNRDREKIIELRVINPKVNLSTMDTDDIIKLVCISIKCNNNCNDCVLKNDATLIKYLKSTGVIEDVKS